MEARPSGQRQERLCQRRRAPLDTLVRPEGGVGGLIDEAHLYDQALHRRDAPDSGDAIVAPRPPRALSYARNIAARHSGLFYR